MKRSGSAAVIVLVVIVALLLIGGVCYYFYHGSYPSPSQQISITSVNPSSGPIGTQITITGTGLSHVPLAYPGGGKYGEGIWLTNDKVWSYLAGPLDTKIVDDNTVVAKIGSEACPAPQSACSSNFSSELAPGTYSLYVATAEGSIVSNKIVFTVR